MSTTKSLKQFVNFIYIYNKFQRIKSDMFTGSCWSKQGYIQNLSITRVELSAIILSIRKTLAIFEKDSILDVWQGSENASGNGSLVQRKPLMSFLKNTSLAKCFNTKKIRKLLCLKNTVFQNLASKQQGKITYQNHVSCSTIGNVMWRAN